MRAAALLHRAVSGDLQRHARWRRLSMVMALAIGVALAYAIDLLHRSALDSFDHAAGRLAGALPASVRAAGGPLPVDDLAALRDLPGVRAVHPVLDQRIALAAAGGTAPATRLLAFDLLADPRLRAAPAGAGAADHRALLFEPRAALLAPALAAQLGAAPGDELQLQTAAGPRDLRVQGLLPAGVTDDRALVLDIAAAQWLLGRLDSVDRADLELEAGQPPESLRAALEARFGQRLVLLTPALETRRLEHASRGYRLNLRLLSLVALLTAGFLVHALSDLALRQRAARLLLLRTLGLGRWRLAGLLGGELALLGAVGAGLGLAAGYALALLATRALGGAGEAYFRLASGLLFEPERALLFAALGIAAALLAALRPLRRAVGAPSRSGPHFRLDRRRLWLGGGALLLAAALARGGHGLAAAYAVIGCLLAGVLLLSPLLPALLARMLAPRALRPGPVGWLLAGSLRGAPRRLASAPVVVAFALLVALAGMAHAFRISLGDWLEQVLQADFYLYAPSAAAGFDPAEQAALRALPEVAAVGRLRDVELVGAFAAADRAPVMLAGRDLALPAVRRMLGLDGVPAEDTAIVSEAFARRFGVAPGDTLRLPVGAQLLELRVGGLWTDYAYDGGRVLVDFERLAAALGDARAEGLALYLAAPPQAASLAARLQARYADSPGVRLTPSAALRGQALAAFDRTFALTYAMVAVALAVSLFAVLNTQALTAIEREQELHTCWQLGCSRAALARLLALEGALAALLGVVGGVMAGLPINWVLNQQVTRHAFNWVLPFEPPWMALALAALALVALAGLSARIFAGRMLARRLQAHAV